MSIKHIVSQNATLRNDLYGGNSNEYQNLSTKKGMTQAELARQMGKSTNTINQWESGVRQPKADLLPQLADNLGCTVDELLRAPAETEAKETPARRREGHTPEMRNNIS